ncbi:MAG TPA: hypothetical protein VGN97_05715 [Mesorhizobium sp.]|jgi:hypothetical protein|nr:hypothetical protein [Mesorhizobium sp.]
MDWDYAIERNREALKQVAAALVAMAALPVLLPGRARPTLPRYLHRAVLRLLRPAEAAARRLVVMAARRLLLTLPPLRKPKLKPTPPPERASKNPRPGAVTGIWLPPQLRPEASRAPQPVRASALPLFDPLPRMPDAKRRAADGVPRICTPGWSAPLPVVARPPLSPDDAVDAARLVLRIQALGRALDDLPGQAKRFARWRMRRDAADARQKQAAGPARAHRLWPLKPGRPPGFSSWPAHLVHHILSDTHALALQALESPDTS